ncbi:unnamed protein product [Ilex paraguariensis]|uniref:Uncharacterized protein n=1 Tax=Ilex paraguariensis TaxID=185542 RepID=A0ABC8TCV4_9AQUA
MAEGRNQSNIVMFPFMAQGHLIPFLALARQLELRKGYTITIVNTPLNIQRLRSSLPPETCIRLAEIPFCATDYGLPPDSENTYMLSDVDGFCLLEASENLESPLKNLLMEITERDGYAPVCIISDMFLGWTVKVANELGIFHSVFIAGVGYSMAIYFSISLNTSLWQTNDEEFSLPDFPEASKIHRARTPNDLKYMDAAEAWFGFRKRQFMYCLHSDAILLNTIEGLGQNGVKYFSRKTGGKPVWTIGPVSTLMIKNERLSSNANSYSEWLNTHPPASVLYVYFGSQSSVCFELREGNTSEVIRHDHIASVIKMVMDKTGKGEELRSKAHAIREKMEEAIREGEGFKGSAVKAMDEFISTATSAKEVSYPPWK